MRFMHYLNEEYCDLYKSFAGGVEVYENPNSDDLKRLRNADEIRFTAVHSTKKLFVWDADHVNHYDMVDYLVRRKHIKPLKVKESTNPDLFNGMAEISGSKLKIKGSDDFAYGEVKLKTRLRNNWDWLKPYFIDLKFIHDLQKDIVVECHK